MVDDDGVVVFVDRDSLTLGRVRNRFLSFHFNLNKKRLKARSNCSVRSVCACACEDCGKDHCYCQIAKQAKSQGARSYLQQNISTDKAVRVILHGYGQKRCYIFPQNAKLAHLLNHFFRKMRFGFCCFYRRFLGFDIAIEFLTEYYCPCKCFLSQTAKFFAIHPNLLKYLITVATKY